MIGAPQCRPDAQPFREFAAAIIGQLMYALLRSENLLRWCNNLPSVLPTPPGARRTAFLSSPCIDYAVRVGKIRTNTFSAGVRFRFW